MLLVRDRPRLTLHAQIESAGRTYRWGLDERDPRYVPIGLTFSDTMPGGFENCSLKLARDPSVDYGDLEEFATLRVLGPGAQVAWEGRLETSPRTSGDQFAITPGAVGWQAALDDDQSVRMIYVDQSRQAWAEATVARQVALAGGNFKETGPNVTADPVTGLPSVETQVNGPADTSIVGEAWYDAQGIVLGKVYYAWKLDGNIDSTDTNWSWFARISDDDVFSSFDTTASLRGAGPGSGTLAATGSRKFAALQLAYTGLLPNSGTFSVFWTATGVYGNHGLATQSPGTAVEAPGLFASDIVTHAVAAWAPVLDTQWGGQSTIDPSAFVIPQAVYLSPTTVSAIIKDVTKYDLQDWAVWEGPTFWWTQRNSRSQHWRARVGASGLNETGPQADRILNGVIVYYQDVTGVTRSVGPTGSYANTINNALSDDDPLNPANVAGITRWGSLTMGVGTATSAGKLGQAFLQEQAALSTAGQATLVGHVEDEHGISWPSWCARSGDLISFVDAHDPSYRRIVSAAYDDDTKTRTITLDSPPDGLQALLERWGAVVMPLGF